jgi:hypothetical protein
VDLVAHAAHVRPDRVGGDPVVGVVERFDFGGNGGVFVGDNTVGDLRVAARHVQGPMPEQGGDDVDGHAAIDGLGGEGVAQPMRVNGAGDPGSSGDALDPAVDGVTVQRPLGSGQEPTGSEGPVTCSILGDEFDEVREQRDEAVVVKLADLEAILARPDTQNVEAASDLAVLIACSFPRAELTPLTYAYEDENDDALAQELAASSSNRERCALLGNAIEQGAQLKFETPSDRAAAARLREIVTTPQDVLRRVTVYAEEALRRLYRQRNLVLHAGITDSVAIQATLRTVPPLVGAGFDRLVHDALASGVSEPLRLVARGRAELELCGQDGGADIWDLLGH